jgi:hypothetical protein
MITRRDLMSGVLASPLLRLVSAPACGTARVVATPYERWNTDRIYSGMSALDDSMGPLSPGNLICVAGRPCSGKTLLLLQMALNVSECCQTNVLFVSFREATNAIGAKAPMDARHRLLYADLEDVPETAGPDESDASPRVWMMAGVPADVPKITAAVARLQTGHPAGCGMVILDGWTSDLNATRKILFGSHRHTDLAACVPALTMGATPALLSDAHIALSHDLAGRAGISVLLGIQTAYNPQMHLGPKSADFLDRQDAVAYLTTQTVWLHRPEIYWKHTSRHHLRGIVRVVGERDRFNGAWPTRSLLHYDRAHGGFLTAMRWWGEPARAECYRPDCTIALQDDLRDGRLEGSGQSRSACRRRPAPR